MRTKLKWLIIVLFAIFAGLQITSPARTNPPFDEKRTLQAMINVPPDVSEIFARSCSDCHSNQTRWLWYTHVAPVSWFTVGHVNEGRAELNFSEWGSYDEPKRKARIKAICGIVEYGSMPLASYLWAHREAELSPADVKKICDWSKSRRSINPVEK